MSIAYSLIMLLLLSFFVIIPLIVLQVILCKKKRKPFGIIIPIVMFVFSLLFCIILSFLIIKTQASSGVLRFIVLFLVLNIPTLICTVIYIVTGSKDQKTEPQGSKGRNVSEMEQMKIQDL